MSGLLEILKEQSSFGFTGRINILSPKNDQFLGVVYQEQGFIVGAHIKGVKAKRALLKMVFDDVEGAQEFKYVIEPEILNDDIATMKLSVEELKQEAQNLIHEFLLAKKLKPGQHLRIVTDPEIIISNTPITAQEFCMLVTLAEWPCVKDIYAHSPLMEFETTHALVSLRKKKALKVFQNS